MQTLIITLVVLVAVLASAQAGCKYNKGPWSECDSQNLRTRTNTLKNKRRNDPSCELTKVETRRCKNKCKYTAEEQQCNKTTNTFVIIKTLNAAKSSGNCETTLNFTKPCRPPKGCRYGKTEAPPTCEDNTVTVALTLVKDKNNGTCPQTYTKVFDVKSCPDFLRKEEKRKLKKAKKRESNRRRKEAKRAEKQQRRKERKNKRNNKNKPDRKNRKAERRERRKNRNPARGAACKYSRGEWTECDMKSDTMSKTSSLLSGPNVCQQKLTVYKKCRKACKYKKGAWGECDPNTMIKERVDTLLGTSSKDFCRGSRTVSKKCGKKTKKSKKGCVYDSGTWGECDIATGLRAKTKTLVTGDPSKCTVEKTVTRSCVRSNGEDRCFFGKWQEWEGCRNGVQKKQRTVIQGGVECQRRGVKTRPCGLS